MNEHDDDLDDAAAAVVERGYRSCTATARTGRRCQRRPIPGGTVCVLHGGKAPAVQAKARVRLATMVEPALGRLARILVTGNDRDAIRAIENVLDRAGIVRGGSPASDEEARAVLVEYLIDLREQTLDGPDERPDDRPDGDGGQ